MNPEAPEITPAQGARLQDVIAGRPGIVPKLKTVACFFLKLIIAAFFCSGMFGILGPLSIVGAVIAVGWTYRLMQRQALKVWWERSPEWYDGVRFETLVSTNEELREHLHWPNWFRGDRWFSSLRKNFSIGLRGVFNSFVLTIIPGLTWFFTWWAGWNDSFNFSYEQTFVNPSRYILGMFVFVAVMFYLPMAQARQAVTGDWRSFYDFRAVRTLVKRRWLACLLLALAYALLSLPVLVLKSAPYFMNKDSEAFLDLPAVEVLGQLRRYLFFASLIVFPAFVFLHLLAARFYAGAVRDSLQAGEVDPVGFEKVGIEKLHIDVPDPRPERSAPTRFVLWAGSLTGRITAGFLAVLIWLVFTFQIVVGQFFNFEKKAIRGWLTQPLVQMPWFDLTPTQLKLEAMEERQEARNNR